MTLDLQEVAQTCRYLKGDFLKMQLYSIFGEGLTTISTINQVIGKKKYRLGELVEVITDRGREDRIIVGFQGFSRASQLKFEDLDEYSRPYFILGDAKKNVMFWYPSAIENVKENWDKRVLQIAEEVENQIAIAERLWRERQF